MVFYTHEQYEDRARVFLDKYELQAVLTCPLQKSKNLKPRKERLCRFCGLKEPDTTFKKVAHLIPELLGNHNLLSEFECDACNEKFSIYENHLANFLGVTRTINGINTKKKLPKYKSASGNFIAENQDFQKSQTGSIYISRNAATEQSITVDPANGFLTVPYPTNPYIPLYVYKSLLKIAISSLPAKEVVNYSHAIKYLTTSVIDKKLVGVNSIFLHSMTLGINYTQPMFILFKKRNESEQLFSHWCLMYFQNFIFQFFIPLNESDFWLYNNEIKVDIPPPLFTEPTTAIAANELGITYQQLDFSGTELKKAEVGFLNLFMGKEQLVNMGIIDPITDKVIVSNRDLNTIVGMKISRTID